MDQSPSQWGNLVRAAFPGYNGRRPRVQLIHGSKDVTLNFKNLQEELDQWSNVLGLSQQTLAQTDQPNVDISGWEMFIGRIEYKYLGPEFILI